MSNHSNRMGQVDQPLQDILEKLPTALTLAANDRADMPIIAANTAFLELCGYPLEQVLGRNCRFLQGDHENDDARAELRAAMRDRRATKVLLRNRHADGASFWNYLSIFPVFADRGTVAEMTLGAQFLLDGQEAAGLQGAQDAWTEDDVKLSLRQHRALLLERRRLSIDAAVRLVESHMLLRSLSRGQAR